jgi:hypothetical protein
MNGLQRSSRRTWSAQPSHRAQRESPEIESIGTGRTIEDLRVAKIGQVRPLGTLGAVRLRRHDRDRWPKRFAMLL